MNAGDLKTLSKGQLKRIDAEAFKDDIVKGSGAKFNIAVGPNGEVYLVPVKSGATPPVPTGFNIDELPGLYGK